MKDKHSFFEGDKQKLIMAEGHCAFKALLKGVFICIDDLWTICKLKPREMRNDNHCGFLELFRYDFANIIRAIDLYEQYISFRLNGSHRLRVLQNNFDFLLQSSIIDFSSEGEGVDQAVQTIKDDSFLKGILKVFGEELSEIRRPSELLIAALTSIYVGREILQCLFANPRICGKPEIYKPVLGLFRVQPRLTYLIGLNEAQFLSVECGKLSREIDAILR